MWYRILPQILNMSLTASMVILFVLLARQVLRRAPRIFSYTLWGIVLFRLLCPVALTSEYSLIRWIRPAMVSTSHISYTEYIPRDLVESLVSPQWMTGDPIDPSDQTSSLSGSLTSDSLPADSPLTGTSSLDFPVLEVPSSDNRDNTGKDPVTILPLPSDPYPLAAPITIATLLWMMGIFILLAYSLRSLHRLRRQLVGAIPLPEAIYSPDHRRAQTNIYLADHITTPFVLGLVRPKIYLPSSLDENQREYILLHEQHHIHRQDHVIKLLAYTALCLHWFNPLVWLAFFLSGKDMEMSCDEAVLRKLGDGIRADYSSSLLSLATGHRILAGAPLAFGEGDTKDRIHHVLHWKKPRTWLVAAALILCAVLAVSLMTNPRQKPSFAGAKYQVEHILYDAPQYSFTYTVETAPQFTITSDYVLMTRSRTDGTDTWHELGGLQQVEYSRTELYELFDPLYCTAHEKLDQVSMVYRVDPINVSSPVFFLVMQTHKGDVMLAQGYGRNEDIHVRWLFLLKRQSGSYDLDSMVQTLVDQYGEGTDYFALYECDTEPGSLLLGIRNDDKIGYGLFCYDTRTEEYVLHDSLLHPFPSTGLYAIKVFPKEDCTTHLMVVFTDREDLESIHFYSSLAGATDFPLNKDVSHPDELSIMVVECPDGLSLGNLHLQYIYRWDGDTDFGYIPTLLTGQYYFDSEDDEEDTAFARLHLQENNTFTFVYDPLSSYISYGRYTIQDKTLMAVTEDGRYQFCFQVVDNRTLRFLAEQSSDVSLIDDRIGQSITDGALFRLKDLPSFEISTEGDDTAKALTIYQDILEQYQLALTEKWDIGTLFDKGLSPLLYHYSDEDSSERIGYALEDLDLDGSYELIIGANAGTDTDAMIFTIYTSVNNQPLHLATSLERNNYYLAKPTGYTYIIANMVSDGASNTAWYYSSLSDGKLDLIQGVIYNSSANVQSPWFLTNDTDWDPSNDFSVEETVATSILDSYANACITPEFIPFDVN